MTIFEVTKQWGNHLFHKFLTLIKKYVLGFFTPPLLIKDMRCVSDEKWKLMELYLQNLKTYTAHVTLPLTFTDAIAFNKNHDVLVCGCISVVFDIYLFKVNIRNHWRRSGVFIANFEHVSHLVLVCLLLILNR